jgi:hypothetical protein
MTAVDSMSTQACRYLCIALSAESSLKSPTPAFCRGRANFYSQLCTFVFLMIAKSVKNLGSSEWIWCSG